MTSRHASAQVQAFWRRRVVDAVVARDPGEGLPRHGRALSWGLVFATLLVAGLLVVDLFA
ncbi:MAG: hypothetical protein QM714_12005 [Nocardioides sp.]|uniref:hypothetical protein n=1 Tax=Nocardioides sp. TaxID=35761 RepID=UPI0039E4C306